MMKRLFDLLVSLTCLVLLLPLLLVLTLLVRLKHGTPIFFHQTRVGLFGHPFELVKFRTMTDERGIDGEQLSDGERLTAFGRLLRATSLDELPQLWNVLKGEMSLVGPRPLLLDYLPLYSSEQLRRHGMRPGITGLAQVSGRNAISWDERFKLDVWYVDNRTLLLDLKIIFITIQKVFRRDGINAECEVTMSKFAGSRCKNKE